MRGKIIVEDIELDSNTRPYILMNRFAEEGTKSFSETPNITANSKYNNQTNTTIYSVYNPCPRIS